MNADVRATGVHRQAAWYRAVKQVQASGTIGDFTHIVFSMRMGDGWLDAYRARQPFFRDYMRLFVESAYESATLNQVVRCR